MERDRILKYSLTAGWFVTALAVLLLALLFVAEESRSQNFWLRVAWAEFLCFLFWGGMSSYLYTATKKGSSSTQSGAIASILPIVLSFYAIASFVTMVVTAYISDDGGNQWHFIVQIVLFLIIALICIFLSVVRITGTTDHMSKNMEIDSPKQLHDFIALHETMIPNISATKHVASALKNLRETVGYSFNDSSCLLERKDYQELCNEVKMLCNSITILEHATEDSLADKIMAIGNKATLLIQKVKLISASQIRR